MRRVQVTSDEAGEETVRAVAVGVAADEYDVSVSKRFCAISVEDAIAQMAAWLDDDSYRAGYRVVHVASGEERFIDAETVDFAAVYNE